MINVLYIETSADRLVGGSFFSLFELMKALDKNKYKKTVVFHHEHDLIPNFLSTGARVFTYKKKPIDMGISGRSSPSIYKRGAWQVIETTRLSGIVRPLAEIRRQKQFAEMVKNIAVQEHFDIIHVNDGLVPALPFIHKLARLRVPIIVHERKIRKYRIIDRLFLKKVAAIICISYSVYRNFSQYFRWYDNAVIVYNPIATELFVNEGKRAEIVKTFHIRRGVPLLVQISNLIHWKGQNTLIEAMRILKERNIEARLLIVGGEPFNESQYVEGLRRKTVEYGLSESVTFCGFQNERAAFMDIADIFIHVPTAPEPFGRVVLEALQMGKPVIASNFGGTAEIIDDKITGVLIPPSSPDSLADAIVHLLNDPCRRKLLGDNGKAVVQKRFSTKSISKNIENIYHRILEKG